jgi:hypothetical protein
MLRLEAEVRNLEELLEIHQYMYNFSRSNAGIHGCVSDIGFFDDLRLAQTVSRRRYMAMRTLVVDDEDTIRAFKKATRSYSGPSTFLPLSTVQRITIDEETQFKFDHPPTDFEGFRGFIVEMVKLRQEHEHMRKSVFFTIFKDMMVFDKLEQLQRYDQLTQTQNFAIALDFYTPDEMVKVYPRFSTDCSRAPFSAQHPRSKLEQVRAQLQMTNEAYTVIRYTY